MHAGRRSSRPPTPPPHRGVKIPRRSFQTTATAATGGHEFMKPVLPESGINAKRVILLFVIMAIIVGGIAAISVVYLWPLFQGPCSYSETPSEYDILLCQRYTDGIECSFDVNQCDFDCVLGYEEDEYECPKSCQCATKGTIESDISFNKINVQSVLTAFINEEDSSYQDSTGSVTLHQNIWNNYKIGRVQIPFDFASSILSRSSSIDAIKSAFKKFSTSTCVDFIPRTNELDFVEFVGDRKGCRSVVGRVGGRQEVWIGDGCDNVGTVLHQLMHVLGFWHEHSRPDRDVFVTVQYNNVAKESKHNFKRLGKGLAKSLDSPYDLSSIMHFDGYSFSTNSMPTIVDKNGNAVTAQRSDLSKEDIAEINQLYQCVITPNMDAIQDGDHWGEWSLWQPCSVSCGKGQSVKVRECLDSLDSVVYSGRCDASGSFEAKECSGATCTAGMWGDWSSCSVTCGEGVRHRASCCHPNVEYETETCTKPDCPPGVSNWDTWKEWGQCSHSCGTGWHRRTRQCVDVTWKVVPSKNCPVIQSGAVEINTCATQLCNNTAAPGWSNWAPWSSCSRTCDSAVQMRHRNCPPGGKCEGVRSEMTPCSLDPCPAAVIPEHLSIWGPWSGWSLCSRSCGEGLVSRQRFCYGENYEIVSKCLGSKADSRDETELGACFKQPCLGEENLGESGDNIGLFSETPDGTGLWSLWLSWSECSATCGKGTIERTRICIGGKVGETGCVGNTQESIDCDAIASCDASEIATWGKWEEWSACSEICNGTKFRYRTCFKGVVLSDTCTGADYQTVPCNDESCISAGNETDAMGSGIVSLFELNCTGGWVASIDFNGDGLGDIVCIKDLKHMQLLENQGMDFLVLPGVTKEFCNSSSGSLLTGDFDGDGSGDILCFDRVNRNSRITFSREGGFVKSEQHDWSFIDFCIDSVAKISTQHMDTDSKSDLVCVESDGSIKVITNEWP